MGRKWQRAASYPCANALPEPGSTDALDVDDMETGLGIIDRPPHCFHGPKSSISPFAALVRIPGMGLQKSYTVCGRSRLDLDMRISDVFRFSLE